MTSEVYGGPESSTQCSRGKHMQTNEENIFSTVTTHKLHLEKLLTHWKHNEACCSESSFSLNQRHVEGERLRGRCSVLTTGSRRDYLNTDRVCTVTSQHQDWERSQLGEGWIRSRGEGGFELFSMKTERKYESVCWKMPQLHYSHLDVMKLMEVWELWGESCCFHLREMISDTKYSHSHLFTREARTCILQMKLSVCPSGLSVAQSAHRHQGALMLKSNCDVTDTDWLTAGVSDSIRKRTCCTGFMTLVQNFHVPPWKRVNNKNRMRRQLRLWFEVTVFWRPDL